MRSLLAVLAFLVMSNAIAEDKPCASAAHRQFDFWVGYWRVTNPDGTLAGHNRIEPILGGCALQESWTGAKGMTGHSCNAYDPGRGVWHQTWVDSSGTLLLLEGGLQGKAMVLSGSQKTPGGAVLNRIAWTPLRKDEVRQLWETSKDGGKTWEIAFDGLYRRAPVP